MASAKDFFSDDQRDRIIQAIRDAEKATSGEVRVHLENHAKPNAFDRATKLFGELEMHKTADHNGVLIFLAVKDQQFAIIGDAGINKAVPDGFWDSVRDTMQDHFVKGNFCLGLCEGIRMTGEKLKAFFPYSDSDVNELSDDISFSDDQN